MKQANNDELAMKYKNAKNRIRQINLELFLTESDHQEELIQEKRDLVKFIKQHWGKVEVRDR
jgi:hypothetical protein